MERKLLYTIGNLYKGYPWGVEAERAFGTLEVHGPFSTENEANIYAHDLVQDKRGGRHERYETPFKSVKVIRIECPQAGQRIVLNAAGDYEYAV